MSTVELAEARTRLRADFRHIAALARRNVLQIRNDPTLLFDAVLMPIVLTLLFVYVFGGAIAGTDNRDVYVDYVIPGLMAMTGLNIAMAVGVGINEDIGNGVMDRLRTMPIARSSVLVARIIVELGRMLVATGILLAVGFALGMRVHTSVVEMFAAIALAAVFGASLMWVFILLGLTVRSAQAVQSMAMLVLMPLQFGSSIFAPTETMPGWLQAFTAYNPLSLLADAARGLITGGPVTRPVWWVLGWATVITVLTAPVAVARFRART